MQSDNQYDILACLKDILPISRERNTKAPAIAYKFDDKLVGIT
jgi:hypothetical protein